MIRDRNRGALSVSISLVTIMILMLTKLLIPPYPKYWYSEIPELMACDPLVECRCLADNDDSSSVPKLLIPLHAGILFQLPADILYTSLHDLEQIDQ